jgi:hypothetical protein
MRVAETRTLILYAEEKRPSSGESAILDHHIASDFFFSYMSINSDISQKEVLTTEGIDIADFRI